MSDKKPTVKPTEKVGKSKPRFKIIFVCTGNTCRSPMAETLLKASLKRCGKAGFYTVSSAGLQADAGADMSEQAKEALKILGYPARKHKARVFKPAWANGNAMIVCMTAGHKARIEGGAVYTVAELTGGSDVGDPYGMHVDAYLSVARYLEYAMDDVLKEAERLRNK